MFGIFMDLKKYYSRINKKTVSSQNAVIHTITILNLLIGTIFLIEKLFIDTITKKNLILS